MKDLAIVPVCLAALALGGSAPGALAPVGSLETRSAVPAQVAGPEPALFAGLGEGYAAYSTGTAYHEIVGNGGGDVEAAFSGAAFTTAPSGPRSDEFGRPVAPDLPAHGSFGRGSAVEVALESVEGSEVVPADEDADASAPPNDSLVTKEVRAELDPILAGDLLRAQASARSAASGCVLGSDLAYGMGAANQTEVADQGDESGPILSLSTDEFPPQAVTQSASRLRLLAPGEGLSGNRFALMAETRQTIAPVTVFDDTPEELIVEVAGEYVLRTVADGQQGRVFFGPDTDHGDRPALRIIRTMGDDDEDNDETLTDIDLSQAFGEDGENFGAPPVVEVFIGEDTRAIGGEETNAATISPTLTAAAVDVLRARIPDPDGGTLHLRIGHMEAAVAVPAAGITCPGIALAKSVTATEVQPGDTFRWTIEVVNPNDCQLGEIELLDTTTAEVGVLWEVVSTDPAATEGESPKLAFAGLGPLGLGQSERLQIEVKVADDSTGGLFTNDVVATGVCAPEPRPEAAESGGDPSGRAAGPPVRVQGTVTLQAPLVVVPDAVDAVTPPEELPPPVATAPGSAAGLPGPTPEMVASPAAFGPTPEAGVDRVRSTSGTPREVRPRPRPGNLVRTGGLGNLVEVGSVLVATGLLLRLHRPTGRSRSRRRSSWSRCWR